MLYDSRSGDLLSLSGQGTAPGKASVDFYKSRGFDEIPTGPGPDAPMSFTVPGIIAALTSMLERYGTKTLGEVLAPAIHHAEFGFPNYEYMLQRLDSPGTREQFDLFPPGGRNIFFDNGNMVAAENASTGNRADGIRAGNDAFYKGDIAKSIVAHSRQVGGILSEDDLANYEAEYGEPIKSTFMGHEISSHSTWTQGIMALQILNILECFDLKAMGHNSPAYTHTMLEATKLAFADREVYYGDPNFATAGAGQAPAHYAHQLHCSKDGTPVMTVGCPGGDHQAQANVQLMLNTLVFGMNAQEAVEAPRFATESVPDSFYPHVYYPNRVSLEQGYPAQNWDTLRALGHGEFVQAATCGMGATIAHRDPQTGVLSAGGDPRRACYALGW
ncbi:Glutathione hydrolase proenzyme [Geodia barretti]|uniref:Glutathione hydrolase proenzyme n=1 Tax=Geodia barretti TaxID=519541 RepID=A0AA35SF06_GEOBA|nr:Glutathione hydrolase proenzyme [Geodia barretti]